MKKSNYVIGHIWLVLFSEGTGRAVYIRLYIYNQQQFQRTHFLQLEDFQRLWIKKCVCIKSIFTSRHKVKFLVKLVVKRCSSPHGTPVARFAVGAQ